jgi:hypothetical protein
LHRRDIIIIIKRMMVSVGTKHLSPFGCIEVRKLVWGRGNSGKPVIKYNVPLRSDGASFRIQHKGNSVGMGWGETKVDHSGGPGLPSVDLLAISQLLLEDIGGTAKDMKVVKISEGPPGSAPNIMGAESCFRIGKVIPEPDCMGNCHWPEGGIRHRGPVDG